MRQWTKRHETASYRSVSVVRLAVDVRRLLDQLEYERRGVFRFCVVL